MELPGDTNGPKSRRQIGTNVLIEKAIANDPIARCGKPVRSQTTGGINTSAKAGSSGYGGSTGPNGSTLRTKKRNVASDGTPSTSSGTSGSFSALLGVPIRGELNKNVSVGEVLSRDNIIDLFAPFLDQYLPCH